MTNTFKRPIELNDRVMFETGRGTLRGHVIDLLPCIGNGRKHALVEIDHALPGIVESVPVDELTALPSINFIFSSGSVDALPSLNNTDRRFWRAKSTDTTGA